MPRHEDAFIRDVQGKMLMEKFAKQKEGLTMNRCGVCNYDIPIDHACNNRLEEDGTVTSYHFGCGTVSDPCPDCGQHRKLCSECVEMEE